MVHIEAGLLSVHNGSNADKSVGYVLTIYNGEGANEPSSASESSDKIS